MIDKLGFKTTQLPDLRGNDDIVLEKSLQPFYRRNSRRLWLKNGATFALRFDLDSRRRPYNIYIEANPSQFSSYNELIDSWQKTFPLFEIKEPIIQRIDCAVNVPIAYEDLRASMYVEHIRLLDYIRSNSETTVFGKKPSRTILYDKAVQSKMAKGTILCRIERQFHNAKCPVRKLNELPQLIDIDPFKVIRFYEICERRNKDIILRGLYDSIEKNGFHNAVRTEIGGYDRVKWLMAHGYLRERTDIDLYKHFKNNLETFFQPKRLCANNIHPMTTDRLLSEKQKEEEHVE